MFSSYTIIYFSRWKLRYYQVQKGTIIFSWLGIVITSNWNSEDYKYTYPENNVQLMYSTITLFSICRLHDYQVRTSQ